MKRNVLRDGPRHREKKNLCYVCLAQLQSLSCLAVITCVCYYLKQPPSQGCVGVSFCGELNLVECRPFICVCVCVCAQYYTVVLNVTVRMKKCFMRTTPLNHDVLFSFTRVVQIGCAVSFVARSNRDDRHKLNYQLIGKRYSFISRDLLTAQSVDFVREAVHGAVAEYGIRNIF